MSKKNDAAPGSPEDLEAKGLVPTMWQVLEEAQAKSREGEFDAVEASAPAGEPVQASTKKEKDSDGS